MVILHVVYVPVYFLSFYLALGGYSTLLSAIPVVTTAWAFGLWGGLIDSVLVFCLNTGLLLLTYGPAQSGDGPRIITGAIELLLLGSITGWLWSNSRRLTVERAARQAAMTELQQVKEFNENIVQSMAEGVTVQDPAGCYTFANPAAAAIFGYPAEDIIGQHWRALFPPDQYHLIEEADARRARGESDHYEVDVMRRDGSRLPVWVSGRPLFTAGAFTGTLAVFTDITTRKQAEAAIHESEARYRALFDGVPVGVYRSTPDGHILDANAALIDMLDYPDRETLLATPAANLYHKAADRARWQAQMQRNGVVQGFEVQLRRYNGTVIWAEDNARMERHPDGGVRFYRGTLENISARVKARNSELDLALERERVTLLQDLITAVSHDFKTPITVINTNLYLLSRVDDPARRAHAVEVIRLQTELLEALIEDTLTLARLDQPAAVTLRSVDVNHVLQSVTSMFRQQAERKDLTLDFTLAEKLPLILGDEIHLHTALEKLVENALQYTPAGGTVHLETAYQRGAVCVKVTDNGMGIPPEDLPHLFRHFFRGDSARSTSGTGLSLTIMKKVVDLHGGTIEVQSEPGAGSTFRLWLPVVGQHDTQD